MFKSFKVVQFLVVLSTHSGDFLSAPRLFEKTQCQLKAYIYVRNHILAFLLATRAMCLGTYKNQPVRKAKRPLSYNSIPWLHSLQLLRRKATPNAPPY